MTPAVASAGVCLTAKEEGVTSANQVGGNCAAFSGCRDLSFFVPYWAIPLSYSVEASKNLTHSISVKFISLCGTDTSAQSTQDHVACLSDPLDECQPMTFQN